MGGQYQLHRSIVFSHWVVLPAVGASGGILLAWRQDLGPATASRVDEHSISV